MASSKGDKSLADKVALLCYKHFDKLPKKGKPVEGREWTIIAAIVKQNESKGNANLEVVSMGTGSKCIGQTKLSSDGDLLNDSHAEIMARRGFLRYLYHQVEEVSAGKESSVLTLDPSSNKFHKKTEVSFIFFSSHTPCGDASIILKENCAELIDSADELQPSNITLEDPQEEPPAKMQRLEIPDVHRTGAKCVESGLQVTHSQIPFIYSILPLLTHTFAHKIILFPSRIQNVLVLITILLVSLEQNQEEVIKRFQCPVVISWQSGISWAFKDPS